MSLSNYKKMCEGGSVFKDEILAFFKTWATMRKINNIKKQHDDVWYNEYCKTTAKIKELLLQNRDLDDIAIVPLSLLKDIDSDMIKLYLFEVFVSHNVTAEFVEDKYIIQLTPKYMAS